jgi:hypothetical protein
MHPGMLLALGERLRSMYCVMPKIPENYSGTGVLQWILTATHIVFFQ